MATNVQKNNKKVQTKNESVHEKKKVRKEYYLMAIFALIFFVSIGTVIYVLLTSESKIISMDDRPIKDVEKVKISLKNTKCEKSVIKQAQASAEKIEINTTYGTEKEELIDLDYDYDPDKGIVTYKYEDTTIFNITISNIPKNHSVIITNDYERDDKQEYKATSENNRKVTYKTKYISSVVNYTISVFYNGDKCGEELVAQYLVTTPMYNPLYKNAICLNFRNYKYCKEFLYEEINPNETYEKIKMAKEESAGTLESQETYNIKLYVIIFVVAQFLITGILTFVLIMINKKREKKEQESK